MILMYDLWLEYEMFWRFKKKKNIKIDIRDSLESIVSRFNSFFTRKNLHSHQKKRAKMTTYSILILY